MQSLLFTADTIRVLCREQSLLLRLLRLLQLLTLCEVFMRDLKEIRKDIDKIDNQLIELFKQRMDCARDVGIYK